MPIIIEKEKERKRNKSNAGCIPQRREEGGSSDTRAKLADGVLDILDFKVYRVSKPDFYTGAVTKTLVGEVFYVNEEADRLKEDSTVAEHSHADGQLSKIDQLRNEQLINSTKCAEQRHDIFAQVNGGAEDLLKLKHGQSLMEHLHPPTIDEVLKFSVDFVNYYSEQLPSEFLNLERAINDHSDEQAHQRRPSRRERSIRGLSSRKKPPLIVSHSGIREPLGSDALQPTADSNSRTAVQQGGKGKSSSLSVQLDIIMTNGTQSFLQNVTRYVPSAGSARSPATTPRSSSAATPRGSSPKNIRREGKRSPTNQRHHRKLFSGKGKKLNSNIEGTENFRIKQQDELIDVSSALKEDDEFSSQTPSSTQQNVVDDPADMILSSKSHTESAIPSIDETEAAESNALQPTSVHKLIEGNEAGDLKSKLQLKVEISKGTDDEVVNPPNGSSAPDKNHSIGAADEVIEDSTEIRPASSIEGDAKPLAPKESKRSARFTRRGFKNKPARDKTHAPSSTVKYSNATLVLNENSEHEGTMNAQTKEAVDAINATRMAFKKSMGYTMGMFSKVKSTTESLQQSISEKINRAENTGFRLLARNKKQMQRKALLRDRALNAYEEKRMLRSVMMEQRLTCFRQDGIDRSSGRELGHNIQRDLKHMHSSAEKKVLSVLIHRITAPEWFPAMISKLRDHMRRLNADVGSLPTCCLRLTIICKHILQFGHSITRDVLFIVVDSAVLNKDDHMKIIVHQSIKFIRDGNGVSAREFLSYFDSRGYEPNPELLNEINMENGMRSGASSAMKKNTGNFFPRAPSSRTFSRDSSVKVRTTATVETRNEILANLQMPVLIESAPPSAVEVSNMILSPTLPDMSEETEEVGELLLNEKVPKPKGALIGSDEG